METIRNYLDNMFCNLPSTKEIVHLKNELLNNMEEKYHELKKEGKSENEAVGIVISQFGNIDELLEEMNIEKPSEKSAFPTISMDVAREFISVKDKTSHLIGLGVSLILLGASLFIFLIQQTEEHRIFQTLSKDAQPLIPLILLILFIVPAVGLFIYSGTKLENFKYIDDGLFELPTSIRSILDAELKQSSSKRTARIIIGVCLCILSSIPLFIGSLFGDKGGIYGLSILLIIIAIAVYIFIRTGNLTEAYEKLLKIGEFNPIQKEKNKVIGAVAGIVWSLATCIFLISGFIFDLWHIGWIVFPITGILFGGFCVFYNTMKEK